VKNTKPLRKVVGQGMLECGHVMPYRPSRLNRADEYKSDPAPKRMRCDFCPKEDK